MRKIFIPFMVLCLTVSVGAGLAAEEKAAVPEAAKTQEKPAPPPAYDLLGAPMPPMIVKAVDGKTQVDLGKLNQVSLFLFVNSSCTACRAEVDFFNRIVEKNKDKMGAYVVTVDYDPQMTTRRFPVLEKGNFVLLNGSDFVLAKSLGFNFTPATVITDKDGKQVFRKGGYSETDAEPLAKELMKQLK